MRVLITGAAGQLGTELVDAFAGHDVLACDRATLDVTDRDRVFQVITTAEPETVIHAGAWTDVDGCEGDPDRAYRVNALGTRHVAEAARMVSARVCFVSTDYVFDGEAGEPYLEWDAPNPVSVYGKSKLGGEGELQTGDAVVRTSWVWGRTGKNFVRTVLARAGAGEPLRVVQDQVGCPTFAGDLAGMIRRLVVARRPGVFHVTNQGATSWYQFACDILAAGGFDPGLVKAITTAELDPPRPAPRPRHSVLDNAALRLSGMPLLPHHREPLKRFVPELV